MNRLDGKVAIVSGSGRGIGSAVALKLAREGASVVVNDLDPGPAEEVVELIHQAGGRAIACVGDVTSPDFGERFVRHALDTFGGLDIIVNNAGYTRDGLIGKQSDEQFQSMLDVHLSAPFRILRAAAEPLRAMAKSEAAEGREVLRKVVNVSSIAGVFGNAGQVNYAAAKAGVIGMTKTLSQEWARWRVCVNCVAFGFIDTRLTRSGHRGETGVPGDPTGIGIPDKARSALLAKIPLGRAGTAEEAAGGVYMLCGPESDYVTGQTLVVAGGLTI